MSERDREQESQITRAVETAIRLGVIYLMAIWVFAIIRPFLSPVLWGIILAVAEPDLIESLGSDAEGHAQG